MGKILWKMGDFGYILISRIISKKWKNDEFHNIAPQIFVNVYGHWFHCVALCELMWMHCVVFFILDLLERYRQNTAEHTTTCSLLQALIKRGPVEVGCWKLCAKFYHRLSLISYSEFLHLFKVVLCPPNSHTHTLKDYTLSLHGTPPPPKTHTHKHTHTHHTHTHTHTHTHIRKILSKIGIMVYNENLYSPHPTTLKIVTGVNV